MYSRSPFQRLIRFLSYWGLVIAFFYALGEAIGWDNIRAFAAAMLGPYIEALEAYDINWRNVLTHPAVMILIVLIAIRQFNRFR